MLVLAQWRGRGMLSAPSERAVRWSRKPVRRQFDVAARRTDFGLKYYKKRDIQKMEPSRTVDFFYIFKHIEGELPCDF